MTTTETGKIDGRVARKTATRDAILDAALELFAARGVTSTSVDDIAAKAGIAKGSIYYHFANKDGLVRDLLVRHASRLVGSLAEASEVSGAAGRRRILQTLLRDIAEHPDVAQVIVTEMFRTDRVWLEAVARWRDQFIHPLVANIVAEQGEAARERAQVQASAWVGATLMAGLDWLMFQPELPIDDVIAALNGLPGLV